MFLKCCHLMIDHKELEWILLYCLVVHDIWCLEFVTSSVIEVGECGEEYLNYVSVDLIFEIICCDDITSKIWNTSCVHRCLKPLSDKPLQQHPKMWHNFDAMKREIFCSTFILVDT